MLIGNLFALVSTDPRGLAAADDPVGQWNNSNIQAMAAFASTVVVGWGAHAKAAERARTLCSLFIADWKLHCLGTNHDGSPKHPLYLAKTAELVRWEP